MNPVVKKDILNVLHQAIEIINKNELFKLRDLSDQVIHNASIFQDQNSITIAVTIYALSKLYRYGNISDFALLHIKNAVSFLEKGDLNKYENEIKNLISNISKRDEKIKFYINEVLEKAEIKKASRMFEHGISMGQVADALGISLWDLMDYVGKTKIIDSFEYKTDVKKRLSFARRVFNIE